MKFPHFKKKKKNKNQFTIELFFLLILVFSKNIFFVSSCDAYILKLIR